MPTLKAEEAEFRQEADGFRRSLVIPIYRNAASIPPLLHAIDALAKKLAPGFEVIFVVDGSPDNSYELLRQAESLATIDCQIIEHSRNFGAFTAIRTGMAHARGVHIAVMAADLQEPPELVEKFFAALDADSADIVFGERVSRQDPFFRKLVANLYWQFYRRIVIPEIPKGGVDVFACNRQVRDVLLAIEEPNSSLVAQLFWVGFRRLFLPYERVARIHGQSAWGLTRRFRYMMDSVFSFSDMPLLAMLMFGGVGLVFTLLVSLATLVGRLSGAIEVPGYTTIVLLVFLIGFVIIVSQGIIGCYLWRAFENTKRRPLSIISRLEIFKPASESDD